MTLARQRVVGVADPYRVGAYNAIIPTTHGHNANILRIFSNSPQSIVGCGDSTHRCRRRRRRTQAGTKRIKQHKRNNKIFSDTCASKGRRGRDPYRVGAHNAIMPITPRTRRKHSSHFLKFSAVHCRVRRLDAPLRRRRHRTQAGTKRIKQHEYSKRTLCPQFRTSNRRLIISIKHFFVQTAKMLFKK